MDVFSAISLLITLSALLSYINHKWLKLPATIGVMFLSLVIGISLKITDSFYPQFTQPIQVGLKSFDFSSFVLNIVLCFLLFAGALHVKFSELSKAKTTVLSYATVGVLISTFFYWLCCSAYLISFWT